MLPTCFLGLSSEGENIGVGEGILGKKRARIPIAPLLKFIVETHIYPMSTFYGPFPMSQRDRNILILMSDYHFVIGILTKRIFVRRMNARTL